ncbi:MAG: hypothetical protein WC488_00150 [Candidatus Micrarchaeia archaeon]
MTTEFAGGKAFVLLLAAALLSSSSFAIFGVEWNRTFPGSGASSLSTMIKTSDAYLLAGSTSPSDYSAPSDIYVVKTDLSGNLVWQKTFGGSGIDQGNGIIETPGGYVVAGSTESFGAVGSDAWIIALDRNGNHLWNVTYGGAGGQAAISVVAGPGGYVAVGYTAPAFYSDVLLFKVDESSHAVDWSKTFGGSQSDLAREIVALPDGYAVLGDITPPGSFNSDFWLIRTDLAGTHLWNRTYGESDGWEYGNSLISIPGGFVLAGDKYLGIYIVKTAGNGDVVWEKAYEFSSATRANSITQIPDGGYVLGGQGAGCSGTGAMISKLDSEGNMTANETFRGVNSISAVIPLSDTSYVAAGATSYSSPTPYSMWLAGINTYPDPNLTIQSPLEAGVYPPFTPIELNYTAAGFNICEYAVDNGPYKSLANCSNATPTGLGVGNHTVKVHARDQNCHSAIVNVTFQITSNALSLQVQSPVQKVYNVTAARLNYTVKLASSCWYTLDGGASVNLPNCWNATLASLAEGRHALAVYATNGTTIVNVTVNFTVDSVPPAISIASPEGKTYYQSSIPLQYSISENASCSYALDSGGPIPLPSCMNITLGSLSSLPHTVTVSARDSAGNTASASVSFVVDTAAPLALTINSPVSGQNVTSTPVHVDYDVSGAVRCSWKLNSGPETDVECGGPITLDPSDGTHTLHVYAFSAAGGMMQREVVFEVSSSGQPGGSGFFCSQDFYTVLNENIYPVSLLAGILAAMIIGLVFAASQALSDPKLSVWSRTEAVQLVMSAAFIFIMIVLLNSFCLFTVADMASIVGAASTSSASVYEGAEAYLLRAAKLSHVAILENRYYLGAINIEEVYSTWKCPLWCFLSIGGTGASTSPQAGASYMSSGFMLLMNSATLSFFSAFMHIFFLKYVGSGLFLFMFPIAIVTRSLPFMRGFGSILLAVLFALYVVYPSILAVLYATVGSTDPDLINIPAPHLESSLKVSANAFSGGGYNGPEVQPGDMAFAAGISMKAFFYSVLLPTMALLGAAAAAAYVGRLMGEEIDLSRLTQMV